MTERKLKAVCFSAILCCLWLLSGCSNISGVKPPVGDIELSKSQVRAALISMQRQKETVYINAACKLITARGGGGIFDVDILVANIAPNISLDIVKFTLKSSIGGSIVFTKDADVVTYGASGRARFTFTIENTTIPPGIYWYEVDWKPNSGGSYPVDVDKVRIKQRL